MLSGSKASKIQDRLHLHAKAIMQSLKESRPDKGLPPKNASNDSRGTLSS